MAAKRRTSREIEPVEPVKSKWEKYGMWVTTAVIVALTVYIVFKVVERRREARIVEGEAALFKIRQDDPTAVMQLEKLEMEYGDTSLAPRITLELAQAHLKKGELAEAEAAFGKLAAEKSLTSVVRAQVNLGLAYAAQEKKDYALARKRFEKVGEDGLYAAEARHMIALIDRLSAPEGPAPQLMPPATPEAKPEGAPAPAPEAPVNP